MHVEIFFFFFLESFNLWRPLLMTAYYHQTKTSISFCCRRELNLGFLIQLSETLPVKLTGTHMHVEILYLFENTLISKLLDILRNNYYNHFKDK